MLFMDSVVHTDVVVFFTVLVISHTALCRVSRAEPPQRAWQPKDAEGGGRLMQMSCNKPFEARVLWIVYTIAPNSIRPCE